MIVGDEPLHVSEPTWKSLGRRYRVYRDRIDLPTWFGHFVIRAEDLVNVEVRPPLVIGDLFRGATWKDVSAIKPDMADLCRHVAIRRRSGIFKQVRVTPEDPEAFVEACRMMMGVGEVGTRPVRA